MGEASIASVVICRFADEIRRRLVEKLRGGDVVDEWLSTTIQSDLKKIKEGLEGIAKTDLLSGINHYENGVILTTFSTVPVSEVDGPNGTGENEDNILQLLMTDINSKAIEEFRNAKQEVHHALNNETLTVEDRILATSFCIKALILENADDPTTALQLCKSYLQRMHAFEEVKSNFQLQVTSSLKKHFYREKRKKIVSSVCEVNRLVFDVAQNSGDKGREFLIWPCVEVRIGRNRTVEIDPLRDPRLSTALQNFREEECIVVRSFGDKILKRPHSIATTNRGEFIVVDGNKPRVFCNSGEHLYDLKLRLQKTTQYHIVDVDTDQDCKVYLLVEMTSTKGNTKKQRFEVFVFDKKDIHLRFELKAESIGRKLAVNSRRGTKTETDDDAEILILEGGKDVRARVEVYNIHGKFVDHFDGRILDDAQDIVGARDGHIFVLDSYGGLKCVREFDAERNHLRSFGVDRHSVAITFDQGIGHIVIGSAEYEDGVYCETVSIYDDNKDPSVYDYKTKRKPDRRMKLAEQGSSPKQNIATTKGRIAVALQDKEERGKVVIV